MRSHDHSADASFCFFFAPVSNCIFTVWVPTCEENMGCPEGNIPFGSGFPIGASSIPVGTRFCSAKSSVLYLLRPLTRERDCRRIGQAVSSGSRRANICKHGRLADIRSSGAGGAALRRSMTEAMLHHRGSKRYIKPAAANVLFETLPLSAAPIHRSFYQSQAMLP